MSNSKTNVCNANATKHHVAVEQIVSLIEQTLIKIMQKKKLTNDVSGCDYCVENYESGRKEGYDKGYSDAEDGYESYYGWGYSEGKENGYKRGFEEGLTKGQNEGRDVYLSAVNDAIRGILNAANDMSPKLHRQCIEVISEIVKMQFPALKQ